MFVVYNLLYDFQFHELPVIVSLKSKDEFMDALVIQMGHEKGIHWNLGEQVSVMREKNVNKRLWCKSSMLGKTM